MIFGFLKKLFHKKTFKEECLEKYCNNCPDKGNDCFIDYATGKCFISPNLIQKENRFE